MAKIFTDSDKTKCRFYYEQGQSPTKCANAMYVNHQIVMTAKTVQNWAKEYGWSDWKQGQEASASASNPAMPFGVSHVIDPILHISEQVAKNYCHKHDNGNGKIAPMIKGALQAVAAEINPPESVLEYLNKHVLRQYIKNMRKFNTYRSQAK